MIRVQQHGAVSGASWGSDSVEPQRADPARALAIRSFTSLRVSVTWRTGDVVRLRRGKGSTDEKDCVCVVVFGFRGGVLWRISVPIAGLCGLSAAERGADGRSLASRV